MQIKRWRFKTRGDDNIIKELNQQLSIGRIAAQLLVQRGITNVKEAQVFLRPHLDDLYDPYLMKDMDRAVDRIQKAINGKEKINIEHNGKAKEIYTSKNSQYLYSKTPKNILFWKVSTGKIALRLHGNGAKFVIMFQGEKNA